MDVAENSCDVTGVVGGTYLLSPPHTPGNSAACNGGRRHESRAQTKPRVSQLCSGEVLGFREESPQPQLPLIKQLYQGFTLGAWFNSHDSRAIKVCNLHLQMRTLNPEQLCYLSRVKE